MIIFIFLTTGVGMKKIIDAVLEEYNWEKAPDTNTTWRIGDGTAAFYNYVYYTVAGFTEHDTFRSNQIREGDLTRERALELVQDENNPRYPNIKWYLDTVGRILRYDYKNKPNPQNVLIMATIWYISKYVGTPRGFSAGSRAF